MIAELEHEGLDVIKANNEIENGIMRIKNLLGQNRLTFDPDCIETITEIENYIYDDKGVLIKKDDHCMDALRYVANEVISQEMETYKPALVI